MKRNAEAVQKGLVAIVVALAGQAAAFAAINVTTGGNASVGGYGMTSAVAGAQTIDFNLVVRLSLSTTYSSGPASFSGLTPASGGTDGSIVIDDLTNQYKAPADDTTNYLTLGGQRSSTVTVDFAGGISYFGLYWGTPDAYNALRFYDASNNLLLAYSPAGSEFSEYFNFTLDQGDAPIARVVLSSSEAAMEVDNLSYVAVPEPAAWLLFGVGAFVVLAGRRRRFIS